MIVRDFEITLRIPETSHIPNCFQVTQNDKDVYNLKVHITDGIDEIDYSQVSSATITFSKADGNVVQGDMAVGVDSLTYTMGTNEIAHPGTVQTSVQLFGADGERLTSTRFRFYVVKDLITPSAVQSTSEFPLLQRIAEDVGDIVPLIPEIEETIQKMPEITQFFDTAAVSETQRISNEATRQTQETARQASIADIEDRFDNLTASQQQDAEVIDARDGEASLNARLSRDKGVVDAHMADNTSAHGIDLKANKSWGSEVSIPLSNGWTGTLTYRKNVDLNLIHLKGEIVPGTTAWNTTIATLTASALPASNLGILASRNESPYDFVLGLGIISTTLRIRRPLSDNIASGDSFKFDVVYKV